MSKNQWIIEDAETPIAPTKATLGQEFAGIPVQATRGLEDILNLTTSLFGEPSMPGYQPEPSLETPQISALSDLLQSRLGLPEQSLQPENLLASGLQRFARGAPGATLSGLAGGVPTILQNLAGLGLGSAIGTGAKAFGAPEGIQDLAQLGTELAFGLKSGRIPTIGKTQKIEHELTKAAVKPGTQVNAEEISKVLNEISNKLTTEVSEKSSNKIRHALETVSNNMFKGKINPVDAMDLRKKLYRLTKELPVDISAEYIEPLTKGINNFFATYAAENPTFYKHLKARDKLTTLKNMNSVLSDAVDFLQLGNTTAGKATKIIINKLLGPTERTIRGLATNSPARKVYFNMVKSATKNDPGLIIKYANQLLKVMPQIKEDVTNEWVIED